MTDHDLPTRTEGEGETLDMPEGLGWFSQGQVLGERYQILEMLGRGGMGEVWKAFDLKLRVEVALKALRLEFFKSERRLDLLRQEVRAAREVMSPNVCRIFDLIEIENRELVSMEYVDGATLLGVLQERGPLELKEAQDIASQFLAGLEAIHKVGLVHRDIKPENIMLTRAGRVVVMDFGLARQETEGGGSVSGTPAYMAPEQAAGQTLDARADVYSAGVVLAEMVSPDGIKSYESRQSLWEGVRSEPAKLPDSPWAPAIKKAVARDRERRYNTAHTLVRALEDVTLRVEGADDLHPYPGLASFTEEDAEYFFGREAEVEQMWRKLDGPARMLGLVGPSGAGKSSFLRAGLIAAKTTAWSVVVCAPGSSPMRSLANAFVEEFAGDSEAMRQMLDFEVADSAVEMVGRWSGRHDHALVIVDQFEELFTQNTADEQRRVADLLNRLVLEADVHVLLSMRDDFLIHCHQFAAFAPLQDGMTLIGPPVGGALRRALVQPATKCGYRFEDDDLVDEMLAEVEGERGALPLLAFAAARLWEMRDRETGLLTRQAYQDIGGVAGALARHAEATVDRIGSEHIGIVRELFRNLVTAEGTRAVREWNELLSIFGNSQSESQPEEVLRALIDARLLTSYEVQEEEKEPTRRVEIIHESLLGNWPRLVRWQTQDADAVQLRDQLRQAAKTWDEQGRSKDYLWAGRAYREYALWQEGYSGGLTDLEDEFATTMTTHAKRRARRRKMAFAAIIAALVGVITIVGMARQRAVAEAARAEASRLVALGQLEIEEDPTAAFAWARASLGVADSAAGRDLAIKALATGSVARVLDPDRETEGVVHSTFFSPDGQWASLHGYTKLKFVHSSGGPFAFIDDFPAFKGGMVNGAFSRDSKSFFAFKFIGEDNTALVRHYEVPGFGMTANLEIRAEKTSRRWLFATRRGVLVADKREDGYPIAGVEVDGTLTPIAHPIGTFDRWDIGGDGAWLAGRVGREVFLQPLKKPGQPRQQIHRFDRDVGWFEVNERFGWIAAKEQGTQQICVWSLSTETTEPWTCFEVPEMDLKFAVFDPAGRRFAMAGKLDGVVTAHVWDLQSNQDTDVLRLRFGDRRFFNACNFDPSGRWLTASLVMSTVFWPMPRESTVIMKGAGNVVGFTSDGKSVVTVPTSDDTEKSIRIRPLLEGGVDRTIDYDPQSLYTTGAVFDPRGEILLAARFWTGTAELVPLDGSPAEVIHEFDDLSPPLSVAYDADRGLVASATGPAPRDRKVIFIRNLDSGTVQVLGPAEDAGEDWDGAIMSLDFLPDGDLLSCGGAGIRRWDLEHGSSEVLYEGPCIILEPLPGGRRSVFATRRQDGRGRLFILDLETHEVRLRQGWEDSPQALALSADGAFVATGHNSGTVLVGRVEDGIPYRLYGHDSAVFNLAFSPDGRTIASSERDGVTRVRSVPDMSKPPLNGLPLGELLAKLDTHTNIRMVRDEDSSTGWTQEVGPFPGWAEVPEW